MVIVLKKDITSEQKNKLTGLLEEKQFKLNEICGAEKTIIAAVGRLSVDLKDLELQDGVESVIPISKPYKMASREFKTEDTIVEVPNNRNQIIKVGGKRIIAIAGPCAIESREQMMAIAQSVQSSGAVMLQGGAYKPRTSPYSFQGLGEEGLKYLKEAGDKYGLPVVTEVVATENIPVMEKYGVDVYQVGARNMQNFELLKKLGKLGKPVILKRGISATLEEWLMSAEYLLSSGTENIILCERGIRTYEKATRNTLDLSAIPVLRGMTHLPVIVDPSHALGIRDKIPPMALASIAAGADGVIVEVHNNPSRALSDGPQSLLPEQFEKVMRDIEAISPVMGKSIPHIQSVKNLASDSKNSSQKNNTVSEKIQCAYCGKRGAYAEQAIGRYFDGLAVAVSMNSFREAFQSVIDGKVDFAMIPIENSLAGSVYDNYDNLTRFPDVTISGAIHMRIQHSLLGVKGATIDDIKKVYSHPQGFLQCSKLLAEHSSWTKIDAASTATAAQFVSENGDKENAAIASVVNAGYYNMEVIRESIEDDPRDYTRFVIISNKNKKDALPSATMSPNKASFMFCVKNEAGALCDCLGIFQKNALNLTRLESRPVFGEPWKYWFYVDAELTEKIKDRETYMADVLDQLKEKAEQIRLLGVYSEENLTI